MSRNPRPASRPNTCSAFGPFARHDEDWTKDPDPTVRRQWQNRIAQRKNRAKNKEEKKSQKEEKKRRQQQQQAKKLKSRGATTSPPSNDALLSGTPSSPMTQERSLSTGPAIDTTFSPSQQMDMYQRLLPNQDAQSYGTQFPATTQAYWSQPMPATPIPASFPRPTGVLPMSGMGYDQFTTYSDSPALSRPFNSPMHPSHFPVAGSPTTTTSGHTMTPTTPLSQAGYLPVNDAPPYCFDYTQAYGNLQVPSTQPYTDPAASGYVPRCFPPDYP